MPHTNESWVYSLSYRQLQKECSKIGLSARGKTAELQDSLMEWFRERDSNYDKSLNNTSEASTSQNNKRKTVSFRKEQSASAIKRQKLEKESSQVTENLICAITCFLPNDPVMAEDGHVYERHAIEEYFRRNADGEDGKVKSPLIGKMIGQMLLPALQHKNTIETLINNGTINGDLADAWKQKEKEKKVLEAHMKKAKEGDADAMVTVAKHYRFGTKVIKKDFGEAYKWYDKARVAGSVRGMAEVGVMLLRGPDYGDGSETVIAQDIAKAMMYLGMAEGKGSDYASYTLGLHMAKGWCGLPVDKAEGVKLIQKSLSGICPIKHMGTNLKEDAQKRLNELMGESSGV